MCGRFYERCSATPLLKAALVLSIKTGNSWQICAYNLLGGVPGETVAVIATEACWAMANVGLSCGQAIYEHWDSSGYGGGKVDRLSHYRRITWRERHKSCKQPKRGKGSCARRGKPKQWEWRNARAEKNQGKACNTQEGS